MVALRSILLEKESNTKQQMLFDHFGLAGHPEIIILAKDFARVTWQQNGIDVLPWPVGMSPDAVAQQIMSYTPDHIVTGTGHIDDRTEQMVWQIARQINIKTTAFLDSSVNFNLRFQDNKGCAIFPNFISVLDRNDVSSLEKLGFKNHNIMISGDLYHDFIKRKPKSALKKKMLMAWGARPSEFIILYASVYIQEMQALGVEFDITEFQALDYLIDRLEKNCLAEKSGPYRLIIRPHPKDSLGKYDKYPEKSTKNLTIIISDEGSSLDAISASNRVAGLSSALLEEAKILGVEVTALEPLIKSRKG